MLNETVVAFNICMYNKDIRSTCRVHRDGVYLTDNYLKVLLNKPNSYNIQNNNGDSKKKLTDNSSNKLLTLKSNALFLKDLVAVLYNSPSYRTCFINNMAKIIEEVNLSDNKDYMFRLKFEDSPKEIIDYAWNHRMWRIIWTHVELEHAFSWLSTLGGAYSALGDYFDHCADKAGQISLRQLYLSMMLGDDGLKARSHLYRALALAQKGDLREAKKLVLQISKFSKISKDSRLFRMCQGVWAKLQYLYLLRKELRLSKK